jgi:hypothetical protein
VIANIPPFADVTSLSIAKTRVFAGTPNNSAYSNSNSELPVGFAEIGNKKAAGTIAIIPNPNTGSFELRITGLQVSRILEVAVFDVMGRKVQQLSNTAVQKVNVNFSKGVYFINATTDNGSISQKVIVQ